ncbi:hydroxyphenylacetyl-CoA thioesterase PaaI [Polynucleobacter sp.]|jgi:acyl-CoA thioesterase|uniref:hydroxyphenylacetyl-CoA thioesterase PaaI n=1 Tax=Polynucleobacter sp. TaxID=2029855 RepID=UPI0037C9D2B1
MVQPELSAQHLAESVRDHMLKEDAVAKSLEMRFEGIGPGYAKLRMTVRGDMLNGFKNCHGGFITTLADTAFAYACNSHNDVTVSSGLRMDFIAPVNEGNVLTAEAKEVCLFGRTGVYDVSVRNQDDQLISVMRGNSYRLKGRHVVVI